MSEKTARQHADAIAGLEAEYERGEITHADAIRRMAEHALAILAILDAADDPYYALVEDTPGLYRIIHDPQEQTDE